MTYRVESTTQAEADIARIFAWLWDRSPDGAWRWYESFWESADRLKTLPLACGLAPENDDFDFELRQMLFGTSKGRTYRALFVVKDDAVQILCVRGPGQRLVKPDEIETSD
jgi:plasmid stabilization system protein ParE